MSNLRNTKVLTAAALLTAIGIVAGFFKIPITNFIEIRFASIPIAAAGYLFGPGIAAIVGILADIGGFIAKPTGPYFPGFTISGAISGIIYGIVLHRNARNGAKFSTKEFIIRLVVAELLNALIVSLLLNSLWLSMLYGKGFIASVTARAVKTFIMVPVNVILLAAILKPVSRFSFENSAVSTAKE